MKPLKLFLVLFVALGMLTIACQDKRETTDTKELTDEDKCIKIANDHTNCLKTAVAVKNPIRMPSIYLFCRMTTKEDSTDTEGITDSFTECVEKRKASIQERKITDPDGTKGILKCVEKSLQYVKKNIKSEKMRTSLETIINANNTVPDENISGHCAGTRAGHVFCLVTFQMRAVCHQ